MLHPTPHRKVNTLRPMKWLLTLRWRTAQFLELRWWQWYLRGQTPTHYLSSKKAYWWRLLDQLDVTIIAGAHVLDAGCGPAGVFTLLHERQRVTALDPLLPRYERLSVFAANEYPGVQFVPEALEKTELTTPFDVIYCFNAINHVADWEKSLDTLTRLARPGTQLVISSDVHRHAWLLPLFRGLPGDALHPQQHLAPHYTEALTRRGWIVEREVELRREQIFSYRAWVCTYT